MLSPAKTDKNCKKEAERKKKNPADFGNYSGTKKPKDFSLGKGLKKASTDKVEEVVVLSIEERNTAVREAINKLEGDDISHIAANGLPVIDAVILLSDIADLTEEEVNVAFCESTDSTLEEIRTHAIMVAISKLEKDNSEHFTSEGVPRVEVLEANTGIVSITADERTAAFDMFNDGALDKEEGGLFSFFKK